MYHFDSYGFDANVEQNYTDTPNITQFAHNCAISNITLKSSTFQYQVMSPDVNTCGRHVSVRYLYRVLDDKEYSQLMLRQRDNPDFIVTCMTKLFCDGTH